MKVLNFMPDYSWNWSFGSDYRRGDDLPVGNYVTDDNGDYLTTDDGSYIILD